MTRTRLWGLSLYTILLTSFAGSLVCLVSLTMDVVHPYVPILATVGTCRRVFSVPLELFIFVAAEASRRAPAGPARFVAAVVVAGLSIALVLGSRNACVGAWIIGLGALCCLTVSSLSLTTEPIRTLSDFIRQIRHVAKRGPTRTRLLAFVFGYAALMILVHGVVEASGAAKTLDVELRTWYNAGRILGTFGSGPRLDIEVFVDYQCPACRAALPAMVNVVNRAVSPSRSIRLATRNFPLDSKCNGSVPPARSPHPAACDAAAAALVVRRAAPARSPEFDRWLFANQTTLTAATVRARLCEMRLDHVYAAEYEALMRQIAADVARGQALGVTATPTVVVNGAKLENITTPERLGRLIALETARIR